MGRTVLPSLLVALPGFHPRVPCIVLPLVPFSKSLRVHDRRSIPQGGVYGAEAPTAKNGLTLSESKNLGLG